MRISTTTLELFRRWKEPDQEWLDEAELIANIKGEFKPTPAMLLGTAFGQVIESPSTFAVRGSESDTPVLGYQHFLVEKGQRFDTYYFEAEMMVPVLELFNYEHGLFEVKDQKRYPGDVDVVAKCDYILGAAIGENKTTESTVDFDKYERSYQWRYMLDIFGAPLCTYNVFQLAVREDRKTNEQRVDLKDVVRFNVFSYPAIHADCCTLLGEFVDYVKARKLDGLLRQRQRESVSV